MAKKPISVKSPVGTPPKDMQKITHGSIPFPILLLLVPVGYFISRIHDVELQTLVGMYSLLGVLGTIALFGRSTC